MWCASVQGQERKVKPPLKSIQVGGPFECIGMDFKERMNRTLKQMLAKVVKKGGKDWDDMLGPVLLLTGQHHKRCQVVRHPSH